MCKYCKKSKWSSTIFLSQNNWVLGFKANGLLKEDFGHYLSGHHFIVKIYQKSLQSLMD